MTPSRKRFRNSRVASRSRGQDCCLLSCRLVVGGKWSNRCYSKNCSPLNTRVRLIRIRCPERCYFISEGHKSENWNVCLFYCCHYRRAEHRHFSWPACKSSHDPL